MQVTSSLTYMESRKAGVLIGPENRDGVKPVGDRSLYSPPKYARSSATVARSVVTAKTRGQHSPIATKYVHVAQR